MGSGACPRLARTTPPWTHLPLWSMAVKESEHTSLPKRGCKWRGVWGELWAVHNRGRERRPRQHAWLFGSPARNREKGWGCVACES